MKIDYAFLVFLSMIKQKYESVYCIGLYLSNGTAVVLRFNSEESWRKKRNEISSKIAKAKSRYKNDKV